MHERAGRDDAAARLVRELQGRVVAEAHRAAHAADRVPAVDRWMTITKRDDLVDLSGANAGAQAQVQRGRIAFTNDRMRLPLAVGGLAMDGMFLASIGLGVCS